MLFILYFVASAPVIEVPPQNSTVLDGKDVIISCRAVGSPHPNTTWVYQGTQVLSVTGRLQVTLLFFVCLNLLFKDILYNMNKSKSFSNDKCENSFSDASSKMHVVCLLWLALYCVLCFLEAIRNRKIAHGSYSTM